MGGRRHLLDIYYEILIVAQDGALISHIGGPLRLQLKLLRKYLDFLIESDLIKVRSKPFGSRTYYFRTEKGSEFIKHYENLKEIINAVLPCVCMILFCCGSC